jgi:hypothetical protein
MNLVEVRKFVAEASKLNIVVVLDDLGRYAMWARMRKNAKHKIIINTKVWKNHFGNKPSRDLDVKAMLLHEIGHLQKHIWNKRSASTREMMAQVWAIRKAKRMGLGDVRKAAIEDFQEWGYSKHNDCYKKARIKFLREKRKY